MNAIDQTMFSRMVAELKELDREIVEVDGKLLKPSQCYRVTTDTGHIMFNTNCPDTLREKINAILDRYKVAVS
jgi:hypothetical protein